MVGARSACRSPRPPSRLGWWPIVPALLWAAACAPGAAPTARPVAPQGATAAGPAPAAAPAGGVTAAPAPIAVRVAYASPGAALAPVWVGFERGVFREHGLDVELVFLSGTRTDQGVISGDTPIGYGTNVVTSRTGGFDVVAISGVVSRIPSILFARPGINSPQDLRGKIVSSTLPGASVSNATLITLRHFGLEPNRDVTIQTTGGAVEKFNLVVQGHADATLMSPPDDMKALEQGLHPIADIAALDVPFLFTAIGTTGPYARDNAEIVQRFIRGAVASVALTRRDPGGAKPIIAKYNQTEDMALVDHAYRYYRDIWGRPDFRVPPEAITSILGVLDVPGADIAKPEDYIDNRFVDELERSGFIRELAPFD